MDKKSNSDKNLKCPFCNLGPDREIIAESELMYSFYDKFPVSLGHALIVPKRHCADYFELTLEEQSDCWKMVNSLKNELMKRYNPDGFNVGINVNEAAGQTIPHAHIHLIPRYKGDVKDPEGGVRGVIPAKRLYLKKGKIVTVRLPKASTEKSIPKQAREISAFFSLVIDETMEQLPSTYASTGIRCFKKRCTGIISSEIDFEKNEIHWKCSKCRNNGSISSIYK
jgi:diadenosine tetraphosphate (Ap4A) HIT family hydrolase